MGCWIWDVGQLSGGSAEPIGSSEWSALMGVSATTLTAALTQPSKRFDLGQEPYGVCCGAGKLARIQDIQYS